MLMIKKIHKQKTKINKKRLHYGKYVRVINTKLNYSIPLLGQFPHIFSSLKEIKLNHRNAKPFQTFT